MRDLIRLATRRAQELVDITAAVTAVAERSRIQDGLVGPSETTPLIEGRLGRSRSQNVFFCDLDDPVPTAGWW